jgi:16S rRNA (guanine527-N7)-methyltransferase
MNSRLKNIDVKLWHSWLADGAKQLEINIDTLQIECLRRFANELLGANQLVNLTSVTDPIEIAEVLMLDSIFPGKFIPPGTNILDLGTGAGFPGIPLKIAYPSLSMTLLDSKRKKINFVKFIIRQLNLSSALAKQARAEEFADLPEFTAAFDVVISRAVTSLGSFFVLAFPFLKKNGIMIAMKGSESSLVGEKEEGLSHAQIDTNFKLNNGVDIQVIPYRLPLSEKERNLVLIRLTGDSINT